MGKTNSNLLRISNQKYEKYNLKYNSKIKEDTAFFFFQNITLLNFFYTFFKILNIFIKNIKIHRTNEFLFIFISYYYTTNMKIFFNNKKNNPKSIINILIETLNIYTKKKLSFFLIFQNTNKYFFKIKNIFKYKFFLRKLNRDLIFLVKKNKSFSIFLKNLINIFILLLKKKFAAQLVVNYIVYFFNFPKFRKQHRQFLNMLKRVFNILITNRQLSNVNGLKIKINGRLGGRNRAKNYTFFNFKNIPINTFKANITYAYNTAYTKNGTLGVKLWVYEKN